MAHCPPNTMLPYRPSRLAALPPLLALSTVLLTWSVACNPNPPHHVAGSGGTTGTGGQTASGGTTGSGGETGSGGVTASGGVTDGSGGTVGSGGVGEGGGTGGPSSSGGSTSSGGSEGGASGTAGAAGRNVGSGGAAGGNSGGGGGPSGPNLITNGDFSMGEASWKVDVASVAHSIVDGRECLMVSGGAVSFFLGWPAAVENALTLKGGTAYTLSYRASSTGPLSVKVEAKVGKAVTPFTDDLPLVTDMVGTSFQTFMHTFTPTADDTQAGVAFKVTPGTMTSQMTTVCFDDVVLAKQ